MANAFNVDVYANLAVCTCRAHCCPSTGVYRGEKISSGRLVLHYAVDSVGSRVGTYGFSNTTLAVAFDQNLTLFPSWWLMEF